MIDGQLFSYDFLIRKKKNDMETSVKHPLCSNNTPIQLELDPPHLPHHCRISIKRARSAKVFPTPSQHEVSGLFLVIVRGSPVSQQHVAIRG
jgi:hypothetical protein